MSVPPIFYYPRRTPTSALVFVPRIVAHAILLFGCEQPVGNGDLHQHQPFDVWRGGGDSTRFGTLLSDMSAFDTLMHPPPEYPHVWRPTETDGDVLHTGEAERGGGAGSTDMYNE